MDATFVQWMVGQSGIAGIAIFAMFLLNKSWRDRTDEQKAQMAREREVAELAREDRRQLIAVVTENAKVITENSRTVSSLQQTIENLTRSSNFRQGGASD